MNLTKKPSGEKTPTKRVHVETWGCQMNVADSEKMLAIMAQTDQYTFAASAEDADLIILNTCHIREKARHKVVSRLGVLKELKKNHPDLTIAVTGCVAQAEGQRLLQEAPTIDVLVGPGKIDQIAELVRLAKATKTPQMATGFAKPSYHEAPEGVSDGLSCQETSATNPSLAGKNEVSRFVTIQQGCDNFCTFCVVPMTRGREVSELPSHILAKVKALVKHGAKEVTLLGQNVNSYGHDLVEHGVMPASPEGPFVGLLRQAAAIPGLDRVRFTTSNPHDLSRPLADLFGQEPKIGRYFHLPVQSGSDRILERMRRKVTIAEYDEKIAWLKANCPDIALSTDLIVGFPGETAADFDATMALIDRIRFSFVFAFAYSPRKKTPAMRFRDQLSPEAKAQRLNHLLQRQAAITVELNEQEIGQTREVLVIYPSHKEPAVYYGRTEHFRLVRIRAHRNLVGQLLPVRITEANKTALCGTLL